MVTGTIIGKNDARLWGMGMDERVKRTFSCMKVAYKSAADIAADDGAVVALSANFVIEPAFVRQLLADDQADTLVVDDRGRFVAARLPASDVEKLSRRTAGEVVDGLPDEVSLADMGALYDKVLRKASQRFVYPLDEMPVKEIEWSLYAGAYKGVTDFFTKYLWPIPAFHMTRFCAHLKLTPNMVTTLSLILEICAFYAFMTAQFGWGILAAWGMCILDTVDGKLARVTQNYSKWGEAYDHGIDMIHPPFWYWAWFTGLLSIGVGAELSLEFHLWVIIGGYVLGRVLEGLFMLVGGIEMWIWRPVDSFFRLIVSRRNPNLFILTLAWLMDKPAEGFVMVSAWTAISLAFQAGRIGTAALLRMMGRPIVSHLSSK